MQVYYADTPDVPLPPGHRFPAAKYRLLLDLIRREAILPESILRPAPLATREELLTAHAAGYVDAVLEGSLDATAQRRIGIPLTPILIERSRATVGGAIAAARRALGCGVSGTLAGGTHHAHRDFGSGFCVFNDFAVTARLLLSAGEVRRVAILDCYVHQGDGTAAILRGDPSVFLVSIHGAKNFPFRKVEADLDIGLPDGAGDAEVLEALEASLSAVLAFRPDIVLYIAGADPLAEDRLGRLAMTHTGLMERDRRVLDACRRAGVPLSIAAGGGYAEPVDLTVAAYANTWRAVREVWPELAGPEAAAASVQFAAGRSPLPAT